MFVELEENRDQRAEMVRILSHLDKRWKVASLAKLTSLLLRLVDERGWWDTHELLVVETSPVGGPSLQYFQAELARRGKVARPVANGPLTATVFGGSSRDPDAGVAQRIVFLPCLGVVQMGNGMVESPLADLVELVAPTMLVGVIWSLQLVAELAPREQNISLDWFSHERGVFPVGESAVLAVQY